MQPPCSGGSEPAFGGIFNSPKQSCDIRDKTCRKRQSKACTIAQPIAAAILCLMTAQLVLTMASCEPDEPALLGAVRVPISYPG